MPTPFVTSILIGCSALFLCTSTPSSSFPSPFCFHVIIHLIHSNPTSIRQYYTYISPFHPLCVQTVSFFTPISSTRISFSAWKQDAGIQCKQVQGSHLKHSTRRKYVMWSRSPVAITGNGGNCTYFERSDSEFHYNSYFSTKVWESKYHLPCSYHLSACSPFTPSCKMFTYYINCSTIQSPSFLPFSPILFLSSKTWCIFLLILYSGR